MRKYLGFIIFCMTLFLASCNSTGVFNDAVAVWTSADLHEGWLDAGRGSRNELNISGKNISIFVRVKPGSIKGYAPLLNKGGNDQSIAYSIALNEKDNGLYIESMLGSDDIAGAHLLKHKLSPEDLNQWHTILFRFNGKVSELYVDGILRDDEVTVGDVRDWNHSPVIIGTKDAALELDRLALWNRFLTDQEVQQLAGVSELKDGKPAYYSETYRPQFHFSAKKNWINDPNGLVFYDGVYHLFFQYMPPHRPGAYKDWGHAISTDLVHWEQIPEPITPHKVWGGCWSGSAVVDEHNVAGFQTGDKKALIAFITNGGEPGRGLGPECTQCIAYSTDGGTTYTYYDGNPVIRNISNANRDPKVVWDEASQQWIMSLFMDVDYNFGLFASTNLKEWKHLSTVAIEGVRECPGFEALPVDGNPSNKKWLFSGANGDYVIGSFDGKNFTKETKVLRSDYGVNYYAAQTWSNVPGGRCLQIAWMPTQRYPGMPFEQQMNFPTEITLRTTPAGIKAFRMPAREIKNLYGEEYKWENQLLKEETVTLNELKGDLYDIDLEIDVKKTSSFDVKLRNVTVHYDAAKRTLSCGGVPVNNGIIPDTWISSNKAEINSTNNLGKAPLSPVDGKIKLRMLLDRTTIEVFGNEGEVVITSCFLPEDANFNYSLTSAGETTVVKAEIHALKSIW